ncbi:hypothetical protein SLS55_006451 [Diplodia seriata]|uniref:Phosphoglycerate mutase family protein n=1 Tax=Diplodia seriata TaxID=420778 RepID=A0ABR3CFC6_9PEZI
MRLFLIRHGETVDNVAQVYAGSKDSELTNHGFQQAQRLARYLKATDVRFTHVFASPLQRARKTAEAILDAQASPVLRITRASAIQEQDFGSFEGKSWLEGPSSNKPRPAGFVDIESKESMARRVDAFLNEHMAAVWRSAAAGERCDVAIVSHGIILSLLVPGRPVSLEYIGGFSNTGYLELDMSTSVTINGKEHLKGLKRTGGGLGSSKHDQNQKSIDTFFKRRRVD